MVAPICCEGIDVIVFNRAEGRICNDHRSLPRAAGGLRAQ